MAYGSIGIMREEIERLIVEGKEVIVIDPEKEHQQRISSTKRRLSPWFVL
jgi:hypothetical protein